MDDAGQWAVAGRCGDFDLDRAATVDGPGVYVAPGPPPIGTDSPVIAETSRLVRPEVITPSVAARSPGRNTITSPM